MSNEGVWEVDGIAPEVVLAWARGVAGDAPAASVILTRAGEGGPVTMDGRATLLHHDVTAVGTFTVVLWAERPHDHGADYVMRQHVLRDRPAPETSEPVSTLRPRVRAFQPDPDRDPILVLDRWPHDMSLPTFDPRQLGFSGAVAFPMAVDLDDDGLDDEPDAVVRTRDKVLALARDLAVLHDEGRDTAAAREHLAQAVTEYGEAVEGA
jgi:hypothetical protein